eukprot:1997462-Pyramimonas_sp.AAC.2
MSCAEWYTSVDSRRLWTVEFKLKAFLAVDSGARSTSGRTVWKVWMVREGHNILHLTVSGGAVLFHASAVMSPLRTARRCTVTALRCTVTVTATVVYCYCNGVLHCTFCCCSLIFTTSKGVTTTNASVTPAPNPAKEKTKKKEN